jgi:hypothetical protein
VPRPDRRTTENRDPHTVYLTPETWEALEQEYLQRRMTGGPGVSKIEFIEDLIRTALPGRKTRTPSVRQPVAAGEASTTSEPTVQTEPPMVKPTPAKRPRPKPASPSLRRKGSAIERLLEASDPGRPAPIVSAAGAPGGGGES